MFPKFWFWFIFFWSFLFVVFRYWELIRLSFLVVASFRYLLCSSICLCSLSNFSSASFNLIDDFSAIFFCYISPYLAWWMEFISMECVSRSILVDGGVSMSIWKGGGSVVIEYGLLLTNVFAKSWATLLLMICVCFEICILI